MSTREYLQKILVTWLDELWAQAPQEFRDKREEDRLASLEALQMLVDDDSQKGRTP